VALPRRNGRSRGTLLFLILLSITVLTLDFRGEGAGVIDRVRDGAGDAIAPIRRVAGSALSPVSSAFNGVTGYDDLEDENAKLKARIEELEGEGIQEEDAVRELRELLALQQLDDWAMGLPQISARVVSAPVSNFEQTIELDKGSRDGIRVDLPVVTGSGLVGRVIDVSSRRSLVRLITDPESSVGVRTARKSQTGIVTGEGAGRRLSVGFVDSAADVLAGDLMVTSGLSGGSDIYPPSIPVARVTKAKAVEGELQKDVEVEPLSDIANLRFVKVLQVPRS
jgi:rod shape-determining protein MreC